jgi:hypothetical protein
MAEMVRQQNELMVEVFSETQTTMARIVRDILREPGEMFNSFCRRYSRQELQ